MEQPGSDLEGRHAARPKEPSSYEWALRYVEAHDLALRPFSTRDDGAALKRTRALLERLGDPQEDLRFVHITGTNGKTSTARVATELALAEGLRVGTFTSPHLERLTERILIEGAEVSEGLMAQALAAVAAAEADLGGPAPGFFEVLTAAAMWLFRQAGTDVVIAEVGIGGRYDATNVIHSEVSVLTSVGLDHVEILGPTLADIASDKLGIVEPSSTLVTGPLPEEVLPLVQDAIERTGSRELRLGRDFAVSGVPSAGGRRLALRTPLAHYEDLWLALRGSHQDANAACAVVALESLLGRPLSCESTSEALKRVTSPGRLERLRDTPLVLCDGAKNPDGARAAAATLEEELPGRTVILVVGLMQGRDPLEMLSALNASRARLLVACEPDARGCLPAGAVAEAAGTLGVETLAVPEVGEALKIALERAGQSDAVLVTGSLYVMASARRAMRELEDSAVDENVKGAPR